MAITSTTFHTDPSRQHWLSLKAGDGLALESLYQLYAGSLYNYGAKFRADKETIKECIQELFVTLWTSKTRLGNPESVKNYLFKAFRLALVKKGSLFQKQVSYEQEAHYDFDATLNAEEAIIDGEQNQALQQRLQATLDQLTARQREVIFLKFYEGLSYEEIAQVMDISVKGTYKVAARAMDALRKKLSKNDFLSLLILFSLKLYC